MRKRVLIFSTYPTTDPRHGGQLRTCAIVDVLRNAEFDVQHFSLYDQSGYPAQTPDLFNIPMSMEFHLKIASIRGRSDVDAAAYFFQSDDHFLSLVNAIKQFNPNIVVLNQPWLWPAVRAVIHWLSIQEKVSIVYASQNIETDLIRERRKEETSNSLYNQVKALEEDLAQKAHLITCVSVHDKRYYERLNNNVVLAPNGVSPLATPGGLEYWSNVYRNIKVALMIGSAHPPNATGFNDMMAPHLGFLAPNERIVVIGGAGHIIPLDLRFRKYSGINNARLDLIGMQDGGGLSTFIKLSSVILLPITEGGGTNIKTAEAIYNRKTIVATRVSFRGYEAFLDLPFIHLADDPSDFRSKTRVCLNSNKLVHTVSDEELARIETLTWPKALAILPEALQKL